VVNNGKMKNSGFYKVILLTVLVTNGHILAQNKSGIFSPEACKVIPDIEQCINSPKIEDRIAVLDQLVVRIDNRCYKAYRFICDLPPQDYHHVIVAVFEGGLYKLRDTEKLREILEKIVYASVQLKLESITPYFLPFLKHDDNIVQMQVLAALQMLQAVQYSREIAQLLSHPDQDVSQQAFQVLVELNAKEAVPELINRLQNPEPSKRYHALRALGKIGDKSAIPHVTPLLQAPHINTRFWALDTLVRLDAHEIISDIWRFYEDGSGGDRALVALVYFDQQQAISALMEKITDKNRPNSEELIEKLVRRDARAIIPALISALEDEQVLGGSSNRGKNILRYIIFNLPKLEAYEAIPVLRQYVKSGDEFLGDAAVQALGKLRAEEAIPDLLPILEKPIKVGGDFCQINHAAVALAQMGQVDVVPALLKFMKRPKTEQHRSKIICELNVILDPQLWYVIQKTKVKGQYKERVDTTLAAFSEQSQIPIIWHCDFENLDSRVPKVNTYVGEISFRFGLDRAVGEMKSTGELYTYILQNGEVHVIPVDEALSWWESYLQNQNNPEQFPDR